jgi:hypothetical protein
MGHNVEIATNGAGSFIDTFPVSDGTQTVERQGVVLVDDTSYAARAKVQNAEPGSSDYGLSIRRVCSGCSMYHAVSAGSTNAANIKASAGRVLGWSGFNAADYPVYVKFHNTAGTPTAGSGVVYTVGAQSGTPFQPFDDDDGLAFSTGIGISIVKGIADADATAVLASDCVINVHFK